MVNLNDEFSFENYIKTFRENLASQIYEDLKVFQKYQVNDIVRKIFPDENFFAYKFSQKSKKEKLAQENTELKRINTQASQHGSHLFINHHEAVLKPIQLENDSKNHFVKNIVEMINFF